MSQAQLAKLAGLAQSAIGNIEAGIRGYGKIVVKVAAALRVTPEYLLLDTDEPGAPQAQPTQDGASFDAQSLGFYLDKITDPEKHARTAHAALLLILREVDGPPPEPPTPEPEPASKKPPALRPAR